jgi:hypothetical protein
VPVETAAQDQGGERNHRRDHKPDLPATDVDRLAKDNSQAACSAARKSRNRTRFAGVTGIRIEGAIRFPGLPPPHHTKSTIGRYARRIGRSFPKKLDSTRITLNDLPSPPRGHNGPKGECARVRQLEVASDKPLRVTEAEHGRTLRRRCVGASQPQGRTLTRLYPSIFFE